VEEPVEDPGPPGRWAVQPGGAGLPLCSDVGRRVPAEEDAESEASGWELRERRERFRLQVSFVKASLVRSSSLWDRPG